MHEVAFILHLLPGEPMQGQPEHLARGGMERLTLALMIGGCCVLAYDDTLQQLQPAMSWQAS